MDRKSKGFKRCSTPRLLGAALMVVRMREERVVPVRAANENCAVFDEDRIISAVHEGNLFDFSTELGEQAHEFAVLPHCAHRCHNANAHVRVDRPSYPVGACVALFDGAAVWFAARCTDEKARRRVGRGEHGRNGATCGPVSVLHVLDQMNDPSSVQRRLGAHNHARLTPTVAPPTEADEREAVELRAIERRFVETERELVSALATEAPTEADAFVDWFQALELNGPGQRDPLFCALERTASREDMVWFLRQEVAGEAGFEDLVALTQVKMPARVKLELARNYWDEMGRGHASGMHGPMLTRLAEELGIKETDPDGVVWESLALANLMVALAANRHYAYHAIGALGVIELTAPSRAAKVNTALKRLGIDGAARGYFALHATLDVKHSKAWNQEVMRPLVEENPALARPMAEGALMRLRAGARCFDRYRRELRIAS